MIKIRDNVGEKLGIPTYKQIWQPNKYNDLSNIMAYVLYIV